MIKKIRKLFTREKPAPVPVELPTPAEHIRHAEPMPPPMKIGESKVPMPSKSRLTKLLRDGFGPTTRFQTSQNGMRVSVWARTSDGHEYPVVELTARDPKGKPAIYFMATCAAFRRLGFALELYPNRIEIVPFKADKPEHANSQIFAEGEGVKSAEPN